MNLLYFYTIFLSCIVIISVLFCGSIIVNSSIKKSKKYKKIIGEVKDIIKVDNYYYQINVLYNIDNTDYNIRLISKKNRNIGDNIDLYYINDPTDPNNLSDNIDNNNNSLIFGSSIIICAICMCICLFLIGTLGKSGSTNTNNTNNTDNTNNTNNTDNNINEKKVCTVKCLI